METAKIETAHAPADHPNGMECPLCNPYSVGSVWYTSWGYDQTNVEYYIVVRETAASVWVEPIGATVRDGRLYPDPEAASYRRGTSPEMHRKARGDHPYLRLDYVRHAWPYDGGGRYDTHAAGLPGH